MYFTFSCIFWTVVPHLLTSLLLSPQGSWTSRGLRMRTCGKGRKHGSSLMWITWLAESIKEASSPVHKADFLWKLAELPNNLLWGQTLAKLLPVLGSGASWLMSLGGHGQGALKRHEMGEGLCGEHKAGLAWVTEQQEMQLWAQSRLGALLSTSVLRPSGYWTSHRKG